MKRIKENIKRISVPSASAAQPPNRLRWVVRFSTWLILGISGITCGSVAAESVEHISQRALNQLNQKDSLAAFQRAFDVGDELFEHSYTAADGVGANIGNGQRFSLVPRADLSQAQQWAQHLPKRVTGPNARSCNVCHSQPFGDGAGAVAMNNIRDPQHSGELSKFINRQPPHIFGIGALQLLAEEMSEQLRETVAAAKAQAIAKGQTQQVKLRTKGVEYGVVSIDKQGIVDYSQLNGIDADLLVKPIEWKGITASVRAFVRDAGHNELGMQATEIVGDGVDGDGDGVVDELSVGDITAMVVYQAAQPRPTTQRELARLGLAAPLTVEQHQQVEQGEKIFSQTTCDSCHKPQLLLKNSVFSEPSVSAAYRDKRFPAGQDPASQGLDVKQAIRFDLTADLPDNQVTVADGSIFKLGNFQRDQAGRTIVRLFGDLKRHDMGPGLAEAIDEAGTGASNFITAELWGVGSTAPYLHDGRATTLNEAITLHGGEAEGAKNRYLDLAPQQRKALVAYLEDLVLYKAEEQ